MEILFIGLGLLSALMFWLLPLFWICRWAKTKRKNYQMVGLVGIVTSWIPALLLALFLPALDDAAFKALNKKQENAPIGELGWVFIGLGVMALGLGGFVFFVSSL